MGNDTIRKTRGKHYTVEDLRRIVEAYERNLCRKNPRPLSQIARELGIPDNSFRDIITRAQTCRPSRFGNKQLQRFSLDMRKLEDNAVKARQRHADAKLFPEAFFHALKGAVENLNHIHHPLLLPPPHQNQKGSLKTRLFSPLPKPLRHFTCISHSPSICNYKIFLA